MKLQTLLFFALACMAFGQTTTPPTSTASTGPSYFTTTGVRYSYYDSTLTETTNIGVRMAGSATSSSTPQGFWTVLSVDATPRSQASSAAARIGARYFLKSAAGGNLIFHTEAGVGLASVPVTSTSSAIQANIQPGVGVTWRVCHTFNPKSSLNCIADFDYDLNWVNSQAVKPLVGVFIGLAF
jgi:hypothetical protein